MNDPDISSGRGGARWPGGAPPDQTNF